MSGVHVAELGSGYWYQSSKASFRFLPATLTVSQSLQANNDAVSDRAVTSEFKLKEELEKCSDEPEQFRR